MQDISEPLTKRELEVLKLLIEGHSNEDISKILFISVATVKSHLQNTYRKLHVTSRTKAMVRAYELRLFSNNEKTKQGDSSPSPHYVMRL